MPDHVSITVSDIAAERFCDAIMKTIDVVKVGRRDNWLGYDERARAVYPERVSRSTRPEPEEGSAVAPLRLPDSCCEAPLRAARQNDNMIKACPPDQTDQPLLAAINKPLLTAFLNNTSAGFPFAATASLSRF